jgi:succinate dehydrogenase / fumarate reductase cytochrome b subunit
MLNRASRSVKTKRDYIAANFASRTMRWSGIILLAFIAFHLTTLTFGKFPAAMPDFVDGDVYGNVVNTLGIWWVAVIYIVSNLALGVHLFHGAWSIFQSLGVNNPRINRARKGFAIGFTALVVGVNITFPIAVLTGIVGY